MPLLPHSLLRNKASEQDPYLQCDALLEAATKEIRKGTSNYALSLLRTAEERSETLDFSQQEHILLRARVLSTFGCYLRREEDVNGAISYLQRAAAVTEEFAGNSAWAHIRAEILLNSARAYLDAQHFGSSLYASFAAFIAVLDGLSYTLENWDGQRSAAIGQKLSSSDLLKRSSRSGRISAQQAQSDSDLCLFASSTAFDCVKGLFSRPMKTCTDNDTAEISKVNTLLKTLAALLHSAGMACRQLHNWDAALHYLKCAHQVGAVWFGADAKPTKSFRSDAEETELLWRAHDRTTRLVTARKTSQWGLPASPKKNGRKTGPLVCQELEDTFTTVTTYSHLEEEESFRQTYKKPESHVAQRRRPGTASIVHDRKERGRERRPFSSRPPSSGQRPRSAITKSSSPLPSPLPSVRHDKNDNELVSLERRPGSSASKTSIHPSLQISPLLNVRPPLSRPSSSRPSLSSFMGSHTERPGSRPASAAHGRIRERGIIEEYVKVRRSVTASPRHRFLTSENSDVVARESEAVVQDVVNSVHHSYKIDEQPAVEKRNQPELEDSSELEQRALVLPQAVLEASVDSLDVAESPSMPTQFPKEQRSVSALAMIGFPTSELSNSDVVATEDEREGKLKIDQNRRFVRPASAMCSTSNRSVVIPRKLLTVDTYLPEYVQHRQRAGARKDTTEVPSATEPSQPESARSGVRTPTSTRVSVGDAFVRKYVSKSQSRSGRETSTPPPSLKVARADSSVAAESAVQAPKAEAKQYTGRPRAHSSLDLAKEKGKERVERTATRLSGAIEELAAKIESLKAIAEAPDDAEVSRLQESRLERKERLKQEVKKTELYLKQLEEGKSAATAFKNRAGVLALSFGSERNLKRTDSSAGMLDSEGGSGATEMTEFSPYTFFSEIESPTEKTDPTAISPKQATARPSSASPSRPQLMSFRPRSATHLSSESSLYLSTKSGKGKRKSTEKGSRPSSTESRHRPESTSSDKQKQREAEEHMDLIERMMEATLKNFASGDLDSESRSQAPLRSRRPKEVVSCNGHVVKLPNVDGEENEIIEDYEFPLRLTDLRRAAQRRLVSHLGLWPALQHKIDEEDDQPLRELEKSCAIAIQKLYRGHVARKEAKKLRVHRMRLQDVRWNSLWKLVKSRTHVLREKAVIRIQQYARSWLQKRRLKQLINSYNEA